MASGTVSATETSYWIKFFTDALIPAGDAAHYAVLFSDNRIQRGMLLDLTKEYLTDMGVSRLGDVIAILKHAKIVHSQDAKDKALKGVKLTGGTASPLRRSTAASRMVGHFLSKDPEAAPMSQPPTPKPAPPASKKSSVFDRLGSDSPVSGNSPKLSVNSSTGGDSVFARLGGKAGQKRSASPGDDGNSATSPLEYQGVLKYPTTKSPPAVPRKKVRVTLDESVTVAGLEKFKVAGPEKFKVTGLDKVKVTGLDCIELASGKSYDMDEMKSIKVQVSSTTTTSPKAKIKRRTTIPVTSSADDDSSSRLSIQKDEVTTTSPRSAGILSMDAPTQSAPVKNRLGARVRTAPATSTTSGFGPVTKKPAAVSDVKSRLGAKTATAQTTSDSKQPSARPKLTITANVSTQPKTQAASGVFSRLGKKSSSS